MNKHIVAYVAIFFTLFSFLTYIKWDEYISKNDMSLTVISFTPFILVVLIGAIILKVSPVLASVLNAIILIKYNKAVISRISLVLYLVWLMFHLVVPTESDILKDNIQYYLSKTYDRNFVVYDINVRKNGWAIAYPVENKSLKFKVSWDNKNQTEFKNDYLDLIWSEQGEKDFEEKLKTIYNNALCLRYSISYFSKPLYSMDKVDFVDMLKEKNYAEALEELNGKASIGIKVCIFSDDNFNKEVEAEKISKIISESILNYNTEAYSLEIFYVNKEFAKEYKEIVAANIDSMHNSKKIINYLFINKHLRSNDLTNNFRY